MIDEIELLRRYGARTAKAAASNIDVTARVLQTLRSRRENRQMVSLRPLAAVAAAGWVAVLATGLLVQEAWSILQDPIVSLLSPFIVAMQ